MVDDDLENRRKEAADWFALLSQRRVANSDVMAFAEWRRKPGNAAAYERIEAMWKAAETLAGDPDLQEATRRAQDTVAPPERARAMVSGLFKPLGAAAALILALALGLVWMTNRPEIVSTAVGEQRTVRLDDGSQVTLDTGSRIEVRLRDDRRTVLLLAGQAFFDVEGDPGRPFVVRAGEASVTAVGTRFSVRRMDEGVKVVLVEGRVSITDRVAAPRTWTLAPGEQIATAAARPEVRPADVAEATSWTAGRLTFRQTPVAAAVAEMNRYTEAPIVLRSARVSRIPLDGVFDVGDQDGLVAALAALYDLSPRREAGTVILEEAAGPGASENNS